MPDQKEIIGSLGLLLVVAGVARVSIPGAMILAGMLLFAYAFMTAVKPVKRGDG